MGNENELYTLLKQLGVRLRKLRQGRDEKLSTVHYETGLSIGIISEIENGKHPQLRMEVLSVLAAHYGLSLTELLNFNDDPSI